MTALSLPPGRTELIIGALLHSKMSLVQERLDIDLAFHSLAISPLSKTSILLSPYSYSRWWKKKHLRIDIVEIIQR
jgi:hypothetical protein